MDEQMSKEFDAFLKDEAPPMYDASNADARYIWTKAWQACAAALSQPAAAEWQPIETAPKDGTTVLLYGTWAGEINGVAEQPTTDMGYWAGGKSDYPGSDWWALATGDAYSCWMVPTQWMPLPAAPKATQ